MKFGVALNVSQAKKLIASKLSVDSYLSFCPATTRLLEENSHSVIPAVQHYRALSHAKAAVLIERDLTKLKPELQAFYKLSDGEAQNLLVYLFHFLCIAYYIYFATRVHNQPDNEFFWLDSHHRIKHGNYREMYGDIVEQGKVKITSYSNPNFSYAHYLLTSMYNRILAAALKFRRKKIIMSFGDESPRKILNAAIEVDDDCMVIASKKVSRNMYQSTRLFMKSLYRALSKPAKDKPVWVFRTSNPKSYKQTPARLHFALTHPDVTVVTQRAIQSYPAFLKAEYAMGKRLIDVFRPNIGISDFAKYPFVLAAQERIHFYGGRYVMMNHGTHTIQFDPISKLAANLWAAQDRVITDFVTDCVPKSPLTYEIAKGLRKDHGYRLHKLNLFQDINTHPTAQDEFIILHAANFMDIYYHIPWCKETSEEYLLGIFELLEEIRSIDGVKLVIKLKASKAGIHKKLVQDYIDNLSLNHKAVIDTATKFSELLAKTSLVVSNLSATVEEALINHIPVMIHTYYKNYFHIPKEVLNPSGLNPAYLVKKKSDIKEIIEFAKKNSAHLFDPKLYANVAWPKHDIVSAPTFARELLQNL